MGSHDLPTSPLDRSVLKVAGVRGLFVTAAVALNAIHTAHGFKIWMLPVFTATWLSSTLCFALFVARRARRRAG